VSLFCTVFSFMRLRRPKQRVDRLTPRRVTIRGETFWQIDLGTIIKDGKPYRQRRTFANREEAETFSRLKQVERTNRGTLSISMDEKLRSDALESARLLAPYGVSVLDAVRDYVRRVELVAKSETVGNAVKALLAAKQNDNLRSRYLKDLRNRLARFVLSFGDRKIADLSAIEIDRWLRELGQSPVSRNTFRLRLSLLFSFAQQCGWVAGNPVASVRKIKNPESLPGILTPEQVARLLEHASFETLPYWLLGVFCGLRRAELERLTWEDIHFDENLVEVPAISSKTASRRFVAMRPNLIEWLAPYREKQALICPPSLPARLLADRKDAGLLEWPPNCLRHSFASYHLAHFRDVKDLALEMGHTRSEVTFRHYRELVRPSEAERFWKIAPVIDAGAKLAAIA
jgi:integrase